MAFVEGRTVKDIIAERPLKLRDVLGIATQTAEGVRAAHEKGIVPSQYDVSADGKRFIIRERLISEQPLSIHVVHNWFEEFRGRQREQTQ